MKRRLSTILFGVVFIAGLSLLLYPTVSDYWNSFHQSRAIASYVDAVDNTDEQKLDEMRKAAQAYNEKLLSKLYVLGETLTYEVDQIRIVLPDELNDLKIEEGQDYCTLITCTPYGVNSHRLLIRGHRIANDAQGLIVEDVKQVQPLHEAIVLGILFLVLYIIICKILSKTILYRFR